MSKKILIIDDNDQDIKIITRYLQNNNFKEIFHAQSGEEGVEKVKELHPEIVVTDTNLTGIDGFETCKRIKDIEGSNVIVIMMTGLIDAIDAGKAREMGADEYCVKTADYAQLIELVTKLS